MESSVIAPGKVFEASGHVDHFKEPMVECQNCHTRFRADHLLEEKGITSAEAEKMSLKKLKKRLSGMVLFVRIAAANSVSPNVT